jgi:hypothetical protein
MTAWELTKLKNVSGIDNQPSIVVPNRELAPVKAIKVAFPRAANMLCGWHLDKNMEASLF